MTHLNEWKKRVGVEKAQQITTEAAGVGTAMHSNLERFIAGIQRQPGNNPVHVQANKMADVIIENGLSKVSEVWAMEQSLYYPGLFSGTTDLVGVHEGEPAVCDHKQTNKPKKAIFPELLNVYQLMLHPPLVGQKFSLGCAAEMNGFTDGQRNLGHAQLLCCYTGQH
jgi:hypothetical protein